MEHAKPLPGYLVQRYQGWKATAHTGSESWFQRLGTEAQRPRALVISCCDSRVQPTDLFGADPGEIFAHRNIANLVPAHTHEGGPHGTSAALEYGITALKVSHVVVIGHSACGGVKGCHDMCAGDAPALEAETSHVGKWIEALRPAYEATKDIADDAARLTEMEKRAVVTSLDNLLTFPFVKAAVEAGDLTLHGLWYNIAEGTLEEYSAENDEFAAL